MKTATDETVTVLWTPGRARRQDAARAQRAADAERARRQDAARAQRAADAERVRKELKREERERQAAQERMEKYQERERQAAQKRLEWEQERLEWERQERLEWERQAARERMEKRLRVLAELDSAAVGSGILFLATAVFFILTVVTGGEWLAWFSIAAVGGAVVCAHVAGIPDPFPPSPEVLDLAMTLPPDAEAALEQVLDSREQELWLVGSARREQRRRALLVRAVHALGDSAAPIVDDAIKQGRDPLTVLLEAALNAPR